MTDMKVSMRFWRRSPRATQEPQKERARAVENGIEIEQITGADLTDEHWDKFFEFYIDTGHRKWGTPYLTRAFFDQIGTSMADDILLIMAKRDGRYIAGALNFIGGDTLFGRNWGALKTIRFCILRVCYYQAIDFAIKRGLHCVEAGAQGAHKLARGYAPNARIRRTTSPMRACAMPSPITLKANGNMWTMTFRRSTAIRRSKNRYTSRLRLAHAADRCL